MTELLKRPTRPNSDGCVHRITPESAGWTYAGFDLYQLEAGQSLHRETGSREILLVPITGTASIESDGNHFAHQGGRRSPFDDTAPDCVYVPAGSSYRVVAEDALVLAVCSAPGKSGSRACYGISGTDIPTETRGKGTNIRHVRNILPDHAEGAADSLIVVEVITPPGNWSSYPPHKHDTDALPGESYLEETYYHRLDPPQGFAFQRVYTDDRSLDQTMTVYDGDVTLVPRGYHPCGAPHGYALYYLNVMAGPKRVWRFTTETDHKWLLD